MSENMFEKASRLKLRFETPQGNFNCEDLWDLPLTVGVANKVSLDGIAVGLNRLLKTTDPVSFVIKDKKADTTLQLKFDIVLHIINVRQAEMELAATAKANADKKQQLLALIATKENEQLSSKSLDDLRAMVASL